MCMSRARRKNITLSADEELLTRARLRAAEQQQSLNELFRTWLAEFTRPLEDASQFEEIMAKLSYVTPGKKFSRDEMNER